VDAGARLAGQADAIAVVHPGRILTERVFCFSPAGAVAGGAGLRMIFPVPCTSGRSAGIEKNPAACAPVPGPRRSGRPAGSFHGLAPVPLQVRSPRTSDADRVWCRAPPARGGCPGCAQIRTAVCRGPAGAPLVEDVAEAVAESIGKARESGASAAAMPRAVDARVTVTVRTRPLARIGQYFVPLGSEVLLGLGIVGIAIRMVLIARRR